MLPTRVSTGGPFLLFEEETIGTAHSLKILMTYLKGLFSTCNYIIKEIKITQRKFIRFHSICKDNEQYVKVVCSWKTVDWYHF